MNVAIAGGRGKIAMLLASELLQNGHTVSGLIRNPDQRSELEEAGVRPIVCDLEGDDDVAAAVRGSDAVVFAAGAGPGSGAERKRTMDLGGAVKLIDAAKAEGISRYLIVSSIGAGNPPAEGGDVFGEYLRAKGEADRALAESGLDYTIVRPGHLTDEPPTGSVALGDDVEGGEIPRADVAAVLAASLHAENTIGKTFGLVSGSKPIDEALASL
jgi:nucleoside-diphosphate-sugar epimerase